MNSHLKGSLLIAGSMVFFSMIGPFVRWINLPATVMIFYYSLFVVIFYLIYFFIKKDFRKLKLKKMRFLVFLSALFLIVNLFGYIKAYSLTTLANAVFTHYTAPIFALVVAVFYLKEKLERISIVAIAISSIGLFLIAYKELAFTSQHIMGISFGVLSGLGYGVLINLNKKIVGNVPISTIIFYQTLIPMLILSPSLVLVEYTLSFNKVILLLIYAPFLIIIPAIMYLQGIKHVKAQHAGIIAYTEPVFVVLIGIFLFSEIPSVNTLIGGLLILVSGYLIIRKGAKKDN